MRCLHSTPKKLCNIFIIKKCTSGITHRLYFFIIIFVIPSTVCLMFGPALPVLEVDGDKPLVVSGQIVPDSSKALTGSQLLLCLGLLLIKKYQTSHF